jgi:hypothetical protein
MSGTSVVICPATGMLIAGYAHDLRFWLEATASAGGSARSLEGSNRHWAKRQNGASDPQRRILDSGFLFSKNKTNTAPIDTAAEISFFVTG